MCLYKEYIKVKKATREPSLLQFSAFLLKYQGPVHMVPALVFRIFGSEMCGAFGVQTLVQGPTLNPLP